MHDIETLLDRWQRAGVVDAEAAARIRRYESEQAPQGKGPRRWAEVAGAQWQGVTALILGALLLACGVALFVSAHWDQLGPGARYALVLAAVAVLHLGGAATRASFRGLSTALHAVGTLAVGPAIAVVGQVFNIEAHWPAAVLAWALAALAGWLLLRDQVQQALTLLLLPAWMLSELAYSAEGAIGANVYAGRFLLMWSVFYLTFFLGSERRVVRGALFAASAVALVASVFLMLSSWVSWSSTQHFVPFSTCVWGWAAIALLPLCMAAFKGHNGLIPIATAIAFCIALPWCYHTWSERYSGGDGAVYSYMRTAPNLAAYTLVAAFAVFLCWWGVRQGSRALVNLGVAGFAITVVWFYSSNILSAVGRSLGLIGLGVLFLAGGWVLEKLRRRILAHMEAGGQAAQRPAGEAQ